MSSSSKDARAKTEGGGGGNEEARVVAGKKVFHILFICYIFDVKYSYTLLRVLFQDSVSILMKNKLTLLFLFFLIRQAQSLQYFGTRGNRGGLKESRLNISVYHLCFMFTTWTK